MKTVLKIFLIFMILGSSSAEITPKWEINCSYYGGILDITPTAKYIVVGSNEGISDVWGIYFYNRSGKLLWCYNFSNFGHIDDLKISKDGKYIITAVQSTYKFGIRRDYVCIFDNKGDLLKKYRIDVGNAKISISSDGKYILVGVERHACLLDRDKGILWDYEAGDTITSISITPDGNYSVVGSDDGNVYFFNRSGLLWKYQTDGCIKSVSINPKMKIICAGGADKWIYLLNYTGKLVNRKYLGYYISYLKLTNNSDVIVDCGIFLLYLDNNLNTVWRYEIDGYYGMDIAATPDGRYIAFYNDDTSCPYITEKEGLYMLNGSNGEVLWQYPSKYFGDVEITPNGKYVVALSYKKLYLFDNQKCIKNYNPKKPEKIENLATAVKYAIVIIVILFILLAFVVYLINKNKHTEIK